MSWWPAVVFGWPAVLLAFVLAVAGAAKKSWAMMAPSVAISIPFSFYLIGTPGGRWLGLAIPLLLIGATGAIGYRRNELAWSLLVPAMAIAGWIAIVVMSR